MAEKKNSKIFGSKTWPRRFFFCDFLYLFYKHYWTIGTI